MRNVDTDVGNVVAEAEAEQEVEFPTLFGLGSVYLFYS